MEIRVHYNVSGRIINICRSSLAGTLPEIQGGYPSIAVEEFLGTYNTHYVLNGQIAERPTIQATVTGSVISGLPVPCEITIEGQTYECTDGTAEIETNVPGTYKVQVKAWPYQDAVIEVTT